MKKHRLFKLSVAILAALCSVVSVSAKQINSAGIATTTLSPDCIEYRVVGICYWLHCSIGCKVRTSVKVRHYIPDAVVTSYIATGESPWTETAVVGAPISGIAESGGEGVTSQANENNVAKFKNVDVIGHPGAFIFNQFMAGFGYSCQGAGQSFIPYFVSTLDSVGWRYNIPEVAYPESLIPGMREIGARTSMDLWGNVYPRGGFTQQADDYKSAATAAQRAGDIVTRHGQPHVYIPLLASKKDGYWPAGALVEADAATGKWQELTPSQSQSCNVFPDHKIRHEQAEDGAYAWALWRPYSCCKRRGQVFLGSVDFQ